MSIKAFTDGETIYFKLSKSGDAVPISKEEAELIAECGPSSPATISHMDEETNIIWFTPASPRG